MFDAAWIGIAFLLGMGARLIGLPPLVGYLAAGFVLFGLGIDTGGTLDHVAEIGITLLLFTIGLKLQLGTLLRPQVWAVTSIHMLLVSLALPAALLGAGAAGLAFASDLKPATALLIGFALSFSSTVFAVKVLEDKGELSSIYGRTAIGILIMQDIAAVVFLAASTGKMPNAWALLLVPGLVPLRWLLHRIMDRAGHSELLILFGLAIALGGAQIFDLAGIKGDLGDVIQRAAGVYAQPEQDETRGQIADEGRQADETRTHAEQEGDTDPGCVEHEGASGTGSLCRASGPGRGCRSAF